MQSLCGLQENTANYLRVYRYQNDGRFIGIAIFSSLSFEALNVIKSLRIYVETVRTADDVNTRFENKHYLIINTKLTLIYNR